MDGGGGGDGWVGVGVDGVVVVKKSVKKHLRRQPLLLIVTGGQWVSDECFREILYAFQYRQHILALTLCTYARS